MANITNFYDKEEKYLLKSLIARENILGNIVNKYENFTIKAYVTYEAINVSPKQVESINTAKKLIAMVQYPVVAVRKSDSFIERNLEIKNGDCIEYKGEIYEISNIELIKDEMKKYYTCNLMSLYNPVSYDDVEEEIYSTFYKVFEYFGVEAIRFSPFFSSEYFKELTDKPFLTYKLEQKEFIDSAKAIIDISKYDSEKDLLNSRVLVHRYYDLIINLYDKGVITNIDIVLGKNKIFEKTVKDLNIDFKNIFGLQVLNNKFVANNDTVVSNIVLNQKKYTARISLDTVFTFTEDYYNKVIVKGK
jgi:hypothetical protein